VTGKLAVPATASEELQLRYDIIIPDRQLLDAPADYVGGAAPTASEEQTRPDEIAEIHFDEYIPATDRLDYVIAASSGLLTAALDVLWVGEFSLTGAQAWGREEANSFVMKVARSKGYRGNDLSGAIRKLESLFKIANDQVTSELGGSLQHHLRDFGHHPTAIGLLFSILTQFTGVGFGTDTQGNFKSVPIPSDELIGKNLPEKLFFAVVVWAFHLISDMAGSSQSAGAGTGIPGPLLAFLKEVSTLPVIKDIKTKYKDSDIPFSVWLSKLFNGTYLGIEDKDKIIKFDLRTEMGILHEIGRQAVPVILNECIVKGFYFIRRLCSEIREREIQSIKDLGKLDPENFLPFKNRTIVRMTTVSSGVFMAVETSSAAVRAVIKNKGINVGFAQDFLLNINYSGIGRFVIACAADSRYIAEDFKKAYIAFAEKHQNTGNPEIDGALSIKFLQLSKNQAVILSSLKLQKVLYDIRQEKDAKQIASKHEWMSDWREKAADGDTSLFIEDEAAIYQSIRAELTDSLDSSWLYLCALELALFKPYFPLNSEQGKQCKTIRACKNLYEKEVFGHRQDVVTNSDTDALITAYKKYIGTMSNRTRKTVIAVAATAAATIATGGLAWAFAPGIAVTIAGGTFAGLHGAALTSASLAALGGGAITAGGLGMAGGTAIIAGGGALLGITGSGAVTLTRLLVSTSKEYTLNECAKLLTFCNEVLIKQYGKKTVVKEIQASIEQGIQLLEKEIPIVDECTDNAEKERKKIEKEKAESLRYLHKCSAELLKLAEG
jgi:hypothetical protein